MTDITPVIEAILTLAVTVITVFIIPYIRSRTASSQQALIQAIIDTAVYAAEQIFAGTGLGERKKAFVLEFLAKKGYTFDAVKIDLMIESAVKRLNIAQGKDKAA